MAKEQEQQKVQKQILILCVDRDGDLDAKAAIKTPIIGRRDNLDAAVTLALKDPEEPDANAMFEAVRTYDRLKEESKPEEVYEIATVSGLEPVGVEADRKIVAELNELLAFFPATEVILVVDGFSDEAVLPLIQSRVPVLSVSRIVVKHSESIEESAALVQRYVRTIWDNPRYSRWVFGIPGMLAFTALVLSLLNLLPWFWIVLIVTLSATMMAKGFGVDRGAKRLYKWMREYSLPPLRIQISAFAAVAGALCIIVGAYLGWTEVSAELAGWDIPVIAGDFVSGSADLVIVGICAALIGRAVRWYMERDPRVLRNAAVIVSVAWSRQILVATSELLKNPETGYQKLVFYVLVGIGIGVISVIVIFVTHRRFKEFFGETEKQVEDFEKS